MDAKSLGVKTDTRHTGLAARNLSGEHFVGVNILGYCQLNKSEQAMTLLQGMISLEGMDRYWK